MKNVLIVDIDTERERQVMFGKAKDFALPTTDEENDKMLLTDIQTLTDALNHLLVYANKDNLRPEIAEFLLNNSPEKENKEMGTDE